MQLVGRRSSSVPSVVLNDYLPEMQTATPVFEATEIT